MSTGYRDPHPHCPGCSGELLPRELAADPASVVDVCRECGGIWVDWFDGDLHLIAQDTGAAPPPQKAPGSARPGQALTPSCPRCRRPLHEERYRDERPVILRCGECAGAFVPRGSAQSIASMSLDGANDDDEDTGFFRKLIERLRKALAD